ncbi:hypothetical protein SAMN02949497_1653 [Methylomagnum ishizawai]|uniref:Uncharacterized protein n=1 Tax=Methylomagnum ishizawai TaxID=1760988 RepID=A0A1Y6D0I8_9GAMM|nr:hypothetical protein [Methylomagnum ishizawai]SMF94343.1 hypothetical protein SAMN02949497_1653 [Methylomagnum ishizawai]
MANPNRTDTAPEFPQSGQSQPRRTERALALQDADLGVGEKVCLAAADYKRAVGDAGFAAAHGGTDALRDDLFFFVGQWETDLQAD